MSRSRYMLVAAMSFITGIGLMISLDITEMDEGGPLLQYLAAIPQYPVTNFMFITGIGLLYKKILECLKGVTYRKRDMILIIIPALFLANSMVWGYSFQEHGSFELVLGGKLRFVKSVTAIIAYFILFSMCIAWSYYILDRTDIRISRDDTDPRGSGIVRRYQELFLDHTFRTSFVTMLLCYFPYIMVSYPGILIADTSDIIGQGYNLPTHTSDYLNLIDESVRLNGHHPIAYTELLHGCIVFGKAIFDSYNIGIFIFSFLQMLFVLVVLAFSLKVIVQEKVDPRVALCAMLYYIISPRIQNYMFLISKDVLSSAAVLLFAVCLFKLGKTDKMTDLVMLVFSGILAGIMRNDGKYVIIGTLVMILLVAKRKDRRLMLAGIMITTVIFSFFYILMPFLHITPTSRREMLSIPFQQTARYIRDYTDEVTEEEKSAIAAVLEYDSLASNYRPKLSDGTKALFNESASTEELIDYFKIWWRMFLKHPGTYIEATINNYYSYFYPGTDLAGGYTYGWSTECMEQANQLADTYGMQMDLHHPEQFTIVRSWYENIREYIFSLPIMSLLICSAVYVWIMLLWICYNIRIQNMGALKIVVPFAVSLAIALLGPSNGGYFRYLYIQTIGLPVTIILGMVCKKGAAHDESGA